VASAALRWTKLAGIGAEFLFQVIPERAERAAIIVTTNLPLSVTTNAGLSYMVKVGHAGICELWRSPLELLQQLLRGSQLCILIAHHIIPVKVNPARTPRTVVFPGTSNQIAFVTD